MLASAHCFLSHLHGRDDAGISSTSADIALQRAPDVGFTGMRGLLQQTYAGQDHSRCAVAALHGVGMDEGLLQGRAIDEHGACSAMAFSTAVLAAGEFEFVAEDPEQEAVGVDLEPVMRL